MNKNYQVSPGSCGSCALEDLFKSHINYPRTSWNAHERNYNKVPPGSRVAYIFTNPYDIILSYVRRGFLQQPYDHMKHISGNMNI